MKSCCVYVLTLLAIHLLFAPAWGQVIERVSVSSAAIQGNSDSFDASISADGRFIAFRSKATNLVHGDTNNKDDIFVYDRDTNLTQRVSVSSSGAQAIGGSHGPSISADGRFVAFFSYANNLVANDLNNAPDIFIHNRERGLTELVSLSSTGIQGNGASTLTSLSADGMVVAFLSFAANLVTGDTNNSRDIFTHDRNSGLTKRVNVSTAGVQGNSYFSSDPTISADGRFVAFTSESSNLVNGDTNRRRDVFVHERETTITQRVNISSTGQQAIGDISFEPSISADGRFVAFVSGAYNLVSDDTNGTRDVFFHDRQTGITKLSSVSTSGEQANRYTDSPSLSADGRFIAFRSLANNLVSGDSNQLGDIFVHDRALNVTQRVNVSNNDMQADKLSLKTRISADGKILAFNSEAVNLVADDTNQAIDIFVAKFSVIDPHALKVTLHPTSGTTQVGDYIRFRARFENTGNTTLTNCFAELVNPLINYQREFSTYSWPLNVANPFLNAAMDIAPGETGQFNLAIAPRVTMRREVNFEYNCDGIKALNIPFLNSLHLTSKIAPLIAEDSVQLSSVKNMGLVIDVNNGKYWTPHSVTVSNTGSEDTQVTVTTTSDFPKSVLRQSRLCEPLDPSNNDWSCLTPRDTQLSVELAAGEVKKILLFFHAYQQISRRDAQNRIYIDARDGSGEVVAKTSLGISTSN